jgi:hypothetical protein
MGLYNKTILMKLKVVWANLVTATVTLINKEKASENGNQDH